MGVDERRRRQPLLECLPYLRLEGTGIALDADHTGTVRCIAQQPFGNCPPANPDFGGERVDFDAGVLVVIRVRRAHLENSKETSGEVLRLFFGPVKGLRRVIRRWGVAGAVPEIHIGTCEKLRFDFRFGYNRNWNVSLWAVSVKLAHAVGISKGLGKGLSVGREQSNDVLDRVRTAQPTHVAGSVVLVFDITGGTVGS